MALTPAQLSTAEPRLARLRALLRGLPDVDVDPAGHGHLAFRVGGKAFAYRAWDHHGDGRIALWVKSTRAEQARLVRDDPVHGFVPAYVGAQGWVGVRLDLDDVPWDLVAGLLRAGWLAQAGKTRAARLADVNAAPRPPEPRPPASPARRSRTPRRRR
ncbi:MAG: MmcQ/YjbR family DNA-binding protein [Planctomycetia bacterium]|nr:MmcQ/YjbR family DNA-binding protein [Planctomycetia bacterium]